MSSRAHRLASLPLAIAFLTAAMLPPRVAVAEKKAPSGHIYVGTATEEDKIKGRPVMVSILADGAIVQQAEVQLGHSSTFSNLPVGTYDVRVEGEGCVTLAKRGIQVREGFTTNVIGGPIEPGKGVHVVEYATGAMTREELTERLARIEAMLAKLESRLASGEKSDSKPTPNAK